MTKVKIINEITMTTTKEFLYDNIHIANAVAIALREVLPLGEIVVIEYKNPFTYRRSNNGN